MTDGRKRVDVVQFDANSGTYWATYDETEQISTTVVLLVASALSEETTELPRLNGVVDPDALNALFGPQFDGSPRLGGTVRFTLADCEVTVHANGEIHVRPP